MGAIGELFSFEGRIGRLGYLCRAIALMIGIVAVTLGGAAVAVRFVRPLGLGDYEETSRWLTIALVLLVLWSSLALASRRLRDMGVEPAHVLPLFAALWIFNAVLIEPLIRLRLGGVGLTEGTWATLQVAVAIPLLLWPGRPAPSLAATRARFEPSAPTAYADWRRSD